MLFRGSRLPPASTDQPTNRPTDQLGQIIEIGCGSGSSTCAFASEAERIDGYDIDEVAVRAAVRRAEVLGQTNLSATAVRPEKLFDTVGARHAPGSADVVLLYAVLEHQTDLERLDTIVRCWELLKPGGLLTIAETPNRLCYFDGHTSLLPFFHMLPEELARRYADRSPRTDFAASIHAAASVSDAHARESLVRWGRGVSYHEFELALGNTEHLLIADGFDPEILRLRPVNDAERLLYTYWLRYQVNRPVGFVREDLYLIFRKPDGRSQRPRTRPLPIRPFRDSLVSRAWRRASALFPARSADEE